MSVAQEIIGRKYANAHFIQRRKVRWLVPKHAPFNEPVSCTARDAIGEYILPFPCIRTDRGWYSARTMTPLHVAVTGWRYSDVR